MDEEALNVSVRKFLKTLGVTAQREIELAVREGVNVCRSRGIPEPFGNAWTATVRCRHAISATEGTDRG